MEQKKQKLKKTSPHWFIGKKRYRNGPKKYKTLFAGLNNEEFIQDLLKEAQEKKSWSLGLFAVDKEGGGDIGGLVKPLPDIFLMLRGHGIAPEKISLWYYKNDEKDLSWLNALMSTFGLPLKETPEENASDLSELTGINIDICDPADWKKTTIIFSIPTGAGYLSAIDGIYKSGISQFSYHNSEEGWVSGPALGSIGMAHVTFTEEGKNTYKTICDILIKELKNEDFLMYASYFSTALKFAPTWFAMCREHAITKKRDKERAVYILGHQIKAVTDLLREITEKTKRACLLMEWDGKTLTRGTTIGEGIEDIVVCYAPGHRFPVSAMQLFYDHSAGPLAASGDQSVAEALDAIATGKEDKRQICINARGNQGFFINDLRRSISLIRGKNGKIKDPVNTNATFFFTVLTISKEEAVQLISNRLPESLFLLILGYLTIKGKKPFWDTKNPFKKYESIII